MEDTKTCTWCKVEMPVKDFPVQKTKRHPEGRPRSWCIPCARAYARGVWHKNVEQSREAQKKWRQEHAQRITRNRIDARKTAMEKYGGKCMCCGETTFEFLTFDHINNDGHIHRQTVPSYDLVFWLRKNNYPDFIQVLCWNCNMAKSKHGRCPHKV